MCVYVCVCVCVGGGEWAGVNFPRRHAFIHSIHYFKWTIYFFSLSFFYLTEICGGNYFFYVTVNSHNVQSVKRTAFFFTKTTVATTHCFNSNVFFVYITRYFVRIRHSVEQLLFQNIRLWHSCIFKAPTSLKQLPFLNKYCSEYLVVWSSYFFLVTTSC